MRVFGVVGMKISADSLDGVPLADKLSVFTQVRVSEPAGGLNRAVFTEKFIAGCSAVSVDNQVICVICKKQGGNRILSGCMGSRDNVFKRTKAADCAYACRWFENSGEDKNCPTVYVGFNVYYPVSIHAKICKALPDHVCCILPVKSFHLDPP